MVNVIMFIVFAKLNGFWFGCIFNIYIFLAWWECKFVIYLSSH